MNEVSFRNDILDEIDEVVTESSTDVLLSLLDASEKAMVILENCTDEDDIWKYSVWQEADENKGEEIDKDKHPFKESSTLKTILMLPINLIKLIAKVISQAFSPKKAEETSKLAAVVAKSKNVFEKVAPFLFKEDGSVNGPVVVTIGGTGVAITIEEILLGKNSVIHKAIRAMKEAWKRIKIRIGNYGVGDLPDEITFTVSKKDASKYDTNIDFDKVNAYIDAVANYLNDVPNKITAIETAKDDATKGVKLKELNNATREVWKLCPTVPTFKQYSAEDIAKFYVAISNKTNQFNQTTANQFDDSYKKAVGNLKTNRSEKGLKFITATLDMYNSMLNILGQIKTVNDTVTNEIAKIAQQAKGQEVAVLEGEAAKKAQEDAAKTADDAAQQDEYEEVTITDGKNPDGFPNDYFTKDADGKYVAVDAGTTQIDPNTKYYKKKKEAAAAAPADQVETGGAPSPYDADTGYGPYVSLTEKPSDFDADPSKYYIRNGDTYSPGKQGDVFEPNKWFKPGDNYGSYADRENAASTVQNGVIATVKDIDADKFIGGKKFNRGDNLTPEEALSLMKKTGAYPNARIEKISGQQKPVIFTTGNKSLLGQKRDLNGNIAAYLTNSKDVKNLKIHQSTDGTITLEYAVDDEDDTPIDPSVSAWYSK